MHFCEFLRYLSYTYQLYMIFLNVVACSNDSRGTFTRKWDRPTQKASKEEVTEYGLNRDWCYTKYDAKYRCGIYSDEGMFICSFMKGSIIFILKKGLMERMAYAEKILYRSLWVLKKKKWNNAAFCDCCSTLSILIHRYSETLCLAW